MKIKKKHFIKKSLLTESTLIDVISKLSPMELKIVKAMIKRFGDGYIKDKVIIDELVNNWGVDFYLAAKLAKFYIKFKYYLNAAPLEGYKEVSKSEVFKEYLSRFILKYDKKNEMNYGRVISDEYLTFKYVVNGNECENKLKTDFWTYDHGVIDYNNYFSFYSNPANEGIRSVDDCYVSRIKSILSTCTFSEVDDDSINIHYKMKHDESPDNEVFNTYEEKLPIPEKLTYEDISDWFINTLYKESYQRALNSTIFVFNS